MFRASGSSRRVVSWGIALIASACVAPAGSQGPGRAAGSARPAAASAPLPIKPRAQIDLAELTQATQRQFQKDDRAAMIWWLPEQFWDEALRRQKSPEPMITAMREVVRPYVVVFTYDVVAVADGQLEGKSEQALRSSIRLRDDQGREYLPLPWAEVSPATTNLLGTMKPLLAAGMGKLGENLHPFVFPAKNAEGGSIADPLMSGSFTVEITDGAFAWDLPLAALIAPRSCPVDSAEFSGTFRFCPFHGVELMKP